MGANLYFKVFKVDGRIENYHFYSFSENIDFILDLVSQLRQQGCQVKFLRRNDWYFEGMSTIGVINIHLDKDEPGDAQGEKIGYLEHYEL